MNLSDAVALVSGGASGLGAATVALLADRGAKVVVLDLVPQASGAASERAGTLLSVAGDVTDPASVERAVQTAVHEFGALDIAVTCAGVATPGRVLRRGAPLELDVFRRVVEVNLVGTFNVVRLAAAAMARNPPRDGERGIIVTTASAAAYDGQIGQAAYAASKAGVAGLTLPVARDLADALIRCVAIAPGIFDTPMVGGLPADVQSSLAAAVPHPRRLGRPSEFAALVAHAIENPMLNGEVVRLDGALRMAPR